MGFAYGKTSCLLFIIFTSLGSHAFAQCTAPNVLTNGEIADATEVMENFHAIAACADQSVTHSGTPQTGEIALFTGERTVSGGNLTGDLTTSGGTVTALAPTGITAGNYPAADITVDAKGRITAIKSGTIPSGASSGWIELSLINADAETGDTTGWTQEGGGFTVESSTPSGHSGFAPHEGTYAFLATPNANPKMYQTIDLTSYATDIDAGNLYALLKAQSADTYSTGEHPQVYFEFFDASDNSISQLHSAVPAKNVGVNNWRIISVEGPVPPMTRSMRAYLWADRTNGTNNNVAFELATAFVRTQ